MVEDDPVGGDAPRLVVAEHITADVDALMKQIAVAFDPQTGWSNGENASLADRYAMALVGVVSFLKSVGVERDHEKRFADLAMAMSQLRDGIQPDWLKPAPLPYGNRPVDPSPVWQARAKVALVVGVLRQNGLSVKGAAARIAREHPKLGKLSGRPLASAIVSWFNKFEAGRINDEIALHVYTNNKAEALVRSATRTRDQREASVRDILRQLETDLVT